LADSLTSAIRISRMSRLVQVGQNSIWCTVICVHCWHHKLLKYVLYLLNIIHGIELVSFVNESVESYMYKWFGNSLYASGKLCLYNPSFQWEHYVV
jgi:hypothetical protein